MSVGFLFFETSAFDLFNSKIKRYRTSINSIYIFNWGNKKIMLVAQQLGQWAEQT
ncbi:YraN family protein, partial [Acinetobacter baumannii]